MDDTPAPAPETLTAHIALTISGQPVEADITVPNRRATMSELLPLFHAVTDMVVDAGSRQVETQGKTISCRAGCGACCRQVVPIAEVEARQIGALVDNLPEPRRSIVRERFAEARRRLEESGLLEPLLDPQSWQQDRWLGLGLAYFSQGIACPFLEDESCSIHAERPMSCREYLVTSPAEHCAQPRAETVRCVKLAKSVWATVARFDEPAPGTNVVRFVPLILAPEWAAAHPDEPPPRPAPEVLRSLFERLAGTTIDAAIPERPGASS